MKKVDKKWGFFWLDVFLVPNFGKYNTFSFLAEYAMLAILFCLALFINLVGVKILSDFCRPFKLRFHQNYAVVFLTIKLVKCEHEVLF